MMRIGYVFQPDRGATDRLLSDVAAQLMAEGMALAGAVQTNIDCAGSHHCDMDLAVLPDGPVLRISQSLGAESSGCRLDAGALEMAVQEVSLRMPGAGLFIVNKFGKHEAEGRGFRGLIADALADDLPVVIGVNSQNHAAFMEFVGDLAEPLAADADVVAGWCRLACMKEAM